MTYSLRSFDLVVIFLLRYSINTNQSFHLSIYSTFALSGSHKYHHAKYQRSKGAIDLEIL